MNTRTICFFLLLSLTISLNPITLLEPDAVISKYSTDIIRGHSLLKLIPRKVNYPSVVKPGLSISYNNVRFTLDLERKPIDGLQTIFSINSSTTISNVTGSSTKALSSSNFDNSNTNQVNCTYSDVQITFSSSDFKLSNYKKIIQYDRFLIAQQVGSQGIFIISQNSTSLNALSLGQRKSLVGSPEILDTSFDDIFVSVTGNAFDYICMKTAYFVYIFEMRVVSGDLTIKYLFKYFLANIGNSKEISDCYYDDTYLIITSIKEGIEVYQKNFKNEINLFDKIEKTLVNEAEKPLKISKIVVYKKIVYVSSIELGLLLYYLENKKLILFLNHPQINSLNLTLNPEKIHVLSIFLNRTAGVSDEFLIEARLDNPKQPTLNRIFASSSFSDSLIFHGGIKFTYVLDEKSKLVHLIRIGVPNVIELKVLTIFVDQNGSGNTRIVDLIDSNDLTQTKLVLNKGNN